MNFMTDPAICHRALVVEDDPAIRKLVEKLLHRRGIAIDTAHDGKEAIAKIQRDGYSIIVLDLMLPEANGFEVIAYMKTNGVGVPVVVVLTDGQVGDESGVLKRLQRELGDARVFTVGIDTAVNGGFLRRLAALGGGTSTLVEPGSRLEEALQAVGREIGTPLVTGLRIDGEAKDLAPARAAALTVGMEYFELMGVGMFLEKSDPNPRKAVRLLWAGEKVRPEYPLPSPTVDKSEMLEPGKHVVSLAGLVLMKLMSNRRKDQVHLDDMIGVRLIDRSWLGKLPPELAERLKQILDTPE